MLEAMKSLVLEGKRVRLEPLTASHAAGLLAAATPELFELAPQGPREWSERGFLDDVRWITSLRDAAAFAIVDARKCEVVGRTAFLEVRPEHRRLEIGRTWIRRESHGTGVNGECKYLMLRHAFEALGMQRVQFLAAHDNGRSLRAIEKLGAAREAVLRNYLLRTDGSVRHAVVFSITGEEWPAVKRRLETRLGAAQ